MSREFEIEAVLGEKINPHPNSAIPLGSSRQGRLLWGYKRGQGPLKVSLIAGCHADEPVGPALLDRWLSWLDVSDRDILQTFTFFVVPHVNPDGEAQNLWTDALVETQDFRGEPDYGYELPSYLSQVKRESPGEDVEFGFPESPLDRSARPENIAVAAFLREQGPFHLHMSFHGMGFAPGPWFLQEAHWVNRTAGLRERLAERVETMSYSLYDVDRKGEKGFWRIGPGFTTRPDSKGMRDFFLARNQPEEAARFRPSSMEFVRSLGGDPLTLVSEMPLFLLEGRAKPKDRRNLFEDLTLRLASGEKLESLGVRPMPIRDQMRLQLAFLQEGLNTIQQYF